MLRKASVLALAAGSLALGGCGDSGTAASGGGSRPPGGTAVPTPTPTPTPDAGCDGAHPHELANTGAIASYFATCGTSDGTSLRVTNTSATVLSVWAAGEGSVGLAAHPAVVRSFADDMVASTHPTNCTDTEPQVCTIGPGASVTADSEAPVDLRLAVELQRTSEVTAASAFGNWVEGKFGSRAQELRSSITDCADSVGQLEPNEQGVGAAVQSELASGDPCGSLVRDVLQETREPETPVAAAAEDAMRQAGPYEVNVERDLVKLENERAVVRALAHLRP